jgi:hypothetical protein
VTLLGPAESAIYGSAVVAVYVELLAEPTDRAQAENEQSCMLEAIKEAEEIVKLHRRLVGPST